MARDSVFVFEDRILTIEAEEAAKEIAFAVKDVVVSQELPYTKDLVYMNLTTRENQRLCIQLSCQGFRIVGNEFNKVTTDERKFSRHFETIYALLDDVSPGYRNSFGDALFMKLSALKETNDIGDSEGQ
ncbi:hypothetical protein CAPTEDRAFT_186190 [Capitella teleta]|uniref:GSKIP domain-containing protein n=1 Tax=Capitella teleta TaxID=283909 RepID=R7UBZ9_CAPTE|nr:hypothetical protein CAPTEDRAFT_186190 [Capitella teleta]|eukprot:ELU03636.1 hypothetical protein CAPTEDRAFT_186190 [Capitella teleta]